MEEQSSISRKDIEVKLIAITRDFLSELGRERALRELTLSAHLQRDLGIDSLGTVELFHRIEDAFGVHIPQSAILQADSLQDVIETITQAAPSVSITYAAKSIEVEASIYHPETAESLVEILIARASKEASRSHIYLQDEAGNEKIITYGDLYQQSLKVASGLQAFGVHAGDTVAIMLPTGEDFFYTFFAVLMLGAIPVPIYPPLRPDHIEEYAIRAGNILRNAEVRLLVTFNKAERLSDLLKVFISSLKAVTTVDVLRENQDKAIKIIAKGNRPALIQYTSGSTSAPKGVLLTHQNLLSNIRAAGKALEISSKDVGVSWLPLYHDMGLIGAWLMPFYFAIPVVIMSPLSFLSRPERWLWAVHYHRATISAAPNFAYELCVRRIKEIDIQGLDLSTWRLTLNGAEAVNPKTIERFTKKFQPFGFKPETMFPVYGLAESSVALCFPPLGRVPKIDNINRELFEKEQKAIKQDVQDRSSLQYVSCGKAIPLHEIRIVDDKDVEVQERVVGHLQFRGPSSMMGYYQNPEVTASFYHEGWWDSGDLAYLAEEEIYITGRVKDTIIKAGRNLYPVEIEEVTSQVPGVRKGCVVAFGIHDAKVGTEKLIVVAETRETKNETHKKMISEITEKLTVVLGIVPDEVILVPPKTVPKTSSGKLQRSACKNLYESKQLKQSSLPFVFQIAKLYTKGLGARIAGWLKYFAKVLYTGYVSILVLISVFFILGCVYILPLKVASRICKSWARVGCWIIGCPIKIRNSHLMPKESPIVFVANHASYIDAIVLLAVLPSGVRFVAKTELQAVPILNAIMKRLNIVFVDRLDFSSNIADTQKMIQLLHLGNNIAIFPEGTFTYATGLRPFKLGAFKMAASTLTPILPVAIKGTRNIFRDNIFLLQPGRITVTLGDLIRPESSEWQEVARVHTLARDAIAKECGEMSLDY